MSKLNRVLICSLVLCGVLVFAQFARSAGDRSEENSCVDCHCKLPACSFFGVKSHRWVGSIHQQHGVTCDKCHGGNPAAAEKEQAHIGVFGSSNPRSSVYFKNVPATCGGCHGGELYKFTQSLHYKMLESTGRGPDCVTCHGSMATKILSPNNLVAICASCHNGRMCNLPYVSQKAKAVLLLLRESQALLAADKQLYHSPRDAQTLGHAEVILHAAKLNWHKFDLDTILKQLDEFHNTLEKLPPASCCR
jgi:hypothetical protein